MCSERPGAVRRTATSVRVAMPTYPVAGPDSGNARLARLAQLYAAFAVPLVLGLLLMSQWLTTDSHHDRAGATFGHDLSQVWVAGRTALAGRAADVYDISLHHQRLIETFGPDAALFVWHYPPVYFGLATGLAALPYAGAVLAWALGSLALLAGTLHRVLGAWRPVLVALALPPVFECLSYGQNSLLTASLLGLGLTLVDRRPIAAGLLFGLLGYKPQLALVVPLVMLATGRWRVAAAALACAALSVAASVAALGPGVWAAFLSSLPETNKVIFEEAWGGLSLNASTFGAVRILGGSMTIAWVAQAVTALVAFGTVLKLWNSPCPRALCDASLIAAVPLVSPYVPVYDLAVLVPAGAFFIVGVRGLLRRDERIAVLALFALALDPRDLTKITHLPCGFMVAGGTCALIVSAAWRRSRSAPSTDVASRAMASPPPSDVANGRDLRPTEA